MEHKEYHVIKKIHKNRGYSSQNGNFWSISVSKDTDTYLSNARPEGKNVELLYEGNIKGIPLGLREKIFLRYENGDGFWFLQPTFPYEFCMGEDKDSGYKTSAEEFSKELGTENVYIYEINLEISS